MTSLQTLRQRLAPAAAWQPVISSGLQHGDIEVCIRAAKALGAGMIRFALTPILCGDRAAAGDAVARLLLQGVRQTLGRLAPARRGAGAHAR